MPCNSPDHYDLNGRKLDNPCYIYRIYASKPGYQGEKCFDDNHTCPNWSGPRLTLSGLFKQWAEEEKVSAAQESKARPADNRPDAIVICDNATICQHEDCPHIHPHQHTVLCTNGRPGKGIELDGCRFNCSPYKEPVL